jgi:hypothetical protein
MKDSIIHVAQVAGVNATAWLITFGEINQLLTTLSLLSAIIFTLYKLYKEIKRNKYK